MNWQQFEQLTGEAFRRQGYAVEETGLGGADGGIDLLLRKYGQTTLVQCKQWRNRQVGVSIVREMYGVLIHESAHAVKIVALGDYTTDARRFSEGKPIELIHGGDLIATVRSLQNTKTRASGLLGSSLALGGSMIASLLVIAALSSATATRSMPANSPAVTAQRPPPRPVNATRLDLRQVKPPGDRPALTSTSRHQAVIYISDSRNDAQLREWKKQNAESMKILEKTTKALPRR